MVGTVSDLIMNIQLNLRLDLHHHPNYTFCLNAIKFSGFSPLTMSVALDAASHVGNGLRVIVDSSPNYGQVAQWLEHCC